MSVTLAVSMQTPVEEKRLFDCRRTLHHELDVLHQELQALKQHGTSEQIQAKGKEIQKKATAINYIETEIVDLPSVRDS